MVPQTLRKLPPDRAFVDHCCELLASVGPCTARRMFGGWGIATAGLNVAIIAWDTLFLKADADSAAHFEAAGSRAFTYEARGKAMKLNYFTAPDEAMESPPAMAPWARLALESALKARQVPVKRTSKATKSVAKKTVSPRRRAG
jgi:DNA transformation protein and related proteins